MSIINNACIELSRELTNDEIAIIAQNYGDMVRVSPHGGVLSIDTIHGEILDYLNNLVDDMSYWNVSPVCGSCNMVTGARNAIQVFIDKEFVEICTPIDPEGAIMLAHIADAQKNGNFYICPRCGRMSMQEGELALNAFSRRFPIYICPDCGTKEALEGAGSRDRLSLNEWNIVNTVLSRKKRQTEQEHEYLECTSAACAYNNSGSCRFSAVKDRDPIITEKNGCEEAIF